MAERLNVSELDYIRIREELILFFRANADFSEFDFAEGSSIMQIINLLAYNTHHLGFNANMMLNESFIDSAILRPSIVSLAKSLGYTPASATAPSAYINVILNDPSRNSAVLEAGSQFLTTIDGVDYSFVNLETISTTRQSGVLAFENVRIYEGTFVELVYEVREDSRYLISDNRADISTLSVEVQNSIGNSDTTTFTRADSLTDIRSDSNVYFLSEVENGVFEIAFGEGVFGRKLNTGNLVRLNFVVTNKTEANGASAFTATTIDGITNITANTISTAIGGAEAESLQSIKTHAPLHYGTQNRCVTLDDYRVFVKRLFPATEFVSVWGGETGSEVDSTPNFGRIFISIKQNSDEMLTQAQKNNLIRDLQQYNVASTLPIIVNPITTNIRLNTTFQYNPSLTSLRANELISNLNNQLEIFNSDNLLGFDNVLYHSQLTAFIDNTDSSIISNRTDIRLAQTLNSNLINFANAIFHPFDNYQESVLSSTAFRISGNDNDVFLDDDGEGNIRLYFLLNNEQSFLNQNIGTINYATGELAFNTLNITSSNPIITIIPTENNIHSVRNNILTLDLTNSIIQAEVINE